MNNIDVFDEIAAKAFAELYLNFPKKVFLDARKLTGFETLNDFGVPINEDGEPAWEVDIAKATLEWLWEAGYFRAAKMSGYGFDGAVLSTMGLTVLKAAPESITIRQSVGDKLVAMVRRGATDGASELVKSALVGGAAWMATNIPGE